MPSKSWRNFSKKSEKNVNSLIGAKDLLVRLDALKGVVQDFAAREQKLNATFHDQSAKENKAFEEKNQQQTVSTSERMSAATDGFAAAKDRLQSRTARRKSRINRAYEALRERLSVEINQQDEACKRRAHQGLADAELQRDVQLAQANTAFEEFQRRLVDTTATFELQEKAVRRAFAGFGRFRKLLHRNPEETAVLPGGGNELLDEFQRVSSTLDSKLAHFKKSPLPHLFRFVPVWLAAVLLVGFAIADPVLRRFGIHVITDQQAVIALVVLAVVLVVYFLGLRAAAAQAREMAASFVKLRRLLEISTDTATERHQQELERIEREFQQTKTGVNQEWKQATREIARRRSNPSQELELRLTRVNHRNEDLHQTRLKRLEETHEELTTRLRGEAVARARQLVETRNERLAKLDADFQNAWLELEKDWKDRLLPLWETLQSAGAAAERLFPGWQSSNPDDWVPPGEFLNAVKFAQLGVETGRFIPSLPMDKRLALPCPPKFSLPLLLTHPQHGSLLFETGKNGDGEAVSAINNIILRLLATTPPGRLEFTIFDPVGLGQNFASLMHLADYEASTINSRIWTQSAQFEEKLAELNEHMEKIIQMYLRNEYATITEYNAEAGSIAEKYHFLVIASFPANFSDTAARRLRNIAANGARCGVFTLIQWDQRNAVPQDFVPDELRNHSVGLIHADKGFEFSTWRAAGTAVTLDPGPPAELATQLLHRIGNAGKNSNRVEVPFEQIAPAELWTEETGDELRVPIGRSGATKLQHLAIGRDTRQHALIAGKTGSGKSTLFHIIITNLALRCSPEEVEFYLVDFKKGVEFKCYGKHRLPHAKVVAIESDRAFGLSVLQRVDDELRRRGDLFRKVGAQDMAGYKRSLRSATASQPAGEPMPRVLLMIDEFQEFFTEEDRVSQNAAVLLDRIVRQGRAFGIHVILGSQTLGGAYTLARATIGQMVIRIALQCNEADAYLIMDQDNPAPRLLSRPGEGIYNDTAGSIEGNSPFQAVWLADQTREEYLAKIRARADQTGREYPGPVVFEGNAPADVRENQILKKYVHGRADLKVSPEAPQRVATPPRIWLGAPNSIKGPTEAVFRRQSASNLLVVGQSDERMLTILSIALVSLAAQHAREGAKFFVLHNLAAGSTQLDFLQRIIHSLPQPVAPAGNANLAEVMVTLSEELKLRSEKESAGPEIFVLVHDLQNFKKLRQEDEFSFSSSPAEATPANILMELITNGPAHGVHVILTCDSYGNVTRFLGRKTLAEIEMRVAFQMSAGDSASLIDAPDASNLGLHRAVLFNDREGSLETFRPYALPGNDWVEEVTRQLAAK
jgi:ABC-type multidrug transport system fused ATPase/permease subunit